MTVSLKKEWGNVKQRRLEATAEAGMQRWFRRDAYNFLLRGPCYSHSCTTNDLLFVAKRILAKYNAQLYSVYLVFIENTHSKRRCIRNNEIIMTNRENMTVQLQDYLKR